MLRFARFCRINSVLITICRRMHGDKCELKWMAISPYGANRVKKNKQMKSKCHLLCKLALKAVLLHPLS